MIVAIDPGVRALGYVIGHGDRIVHASLSRAGARWGAPRCAQYHEQEIRDALRGRGVDRVILESMNYNGRQSTTPNDLIAVQTVGCLTARAICARVDLQDPSWTSVPKAVGVSRLLGSEGRPGVLSDAEREIVARGARLAGSNAKEVLDAARLFVYSVGRADRAGSRIEKW